MIDHTQVCLGKREPRYDERTLVMAKYIDMALSPPPSAVNWAQKIPAGLWGMKKNDTEGDCTCAGVAHVIMGWTVNASKLVNPSDAAVESMYEAFGFDPNNPEETDNGAVELDVLKYWRNTGMLLPDGSRDKLGAFASVAPRNTTLVKDSIYLMGTIYSGISLPISAQKQSVWDVPPGGARGKGKAGSWGGHCVPIFAYNSRGLLCVTWGSLQWMTWAFWKTYADEAYALFSKDWINGSGKAPNGIDKGTLISDLGKL